MVFRVAAKVRLAEAIRRLVDLYTARDKPEESAKWKEKLDESAAKPLPKTEPAKDNGSP